MIISYTPEGAETQRYPINMDKVLFPEAVAIEKRTGWTYDEFKVQLIKGNALARITMLHTLLNRVHPGKIKFDELAANLPVGAIVAEFDDEELDEMVALANEDKSLDDEDRPQILAALERLRPSAVDAPKAPAVNEDVTTS